MQNVGNYFEELLKEQECKEIDTKSLTRDKKCQNNSGHCTVQVIQEDHVTTQKHLKLLITIPNYDISDCTLQHRHVNRHFHPPYFDP